MQKPPRTLASPFAVAPLMSVARLAGAPLAAARRAAALAFALSALALCSCSGDGQGGSVDDCDQECIDRSALRGVRETLKLVYNLTLQGNPVGAQDETTPCPTGGSARVFGEASSSPTQGTTRVDLSYELAACGYTQRDETPDENYALVIDGTFRQTGTIAVQPATTTALLIDAEGVSLEGTVYDPPIDYVERDCTIDLAQDGDALVGTLCGRDANIDDL